MGLLGFFGRREKAERPYSKFLLPPSQNVDYTDFSDSIILQKINPENLHPPRNPGSGIFGVWRSLVAHYFGVVGVVGSNPATPTKSWKVKKWKVDS